MRYPMLNVLFISGYPDDELVRDVAEYQLPFVAKPFSMGDLLQTVRQLLDAERQATTNLPEPS